MTGTRSVDRRARGRLAAGVTTLALAFAGVAAAAPAGAAERCTGTTAGGDWARYGQDPMGQQRQVAERRIGAATVASLQPRWTVEGTGYQSAPPIVAGGCVFVNAQGQITAYDLRTGRQLWGSDDVDTTGSFAPTVVAGRVHVGMYNGGRPRAAALDVRDGSLLWLSEEIHFGRDTNQMASAVVHDGIQVLFTTGPDFEPDARQGYALLDAATGEVLHKATTIPPSELAAGYAGGGVWGTPTVDPLTDYLYVGTSNPESKRREHAYDNAIIKLDLDRRRPTFGRIVGSYKGTPDSVTGYDNPVCQTVGEAVWLDAGPYGSSPLCGQLDVDFGNGPTLWRDPSGRLLAAATQKSGVLHVIDARTMEAVWTRQLWAPMSFLGGNLGRIATDGRTLYVAANPGAVIAFDTVTGAERWRWMPVANIPMTGGNVALANGVVYWVSDFWVNALDARSGELLWRSELATSQASLANSVAIAGNRVVANRSGTITAFALG